MISRRILSLSILLVPATVLAQQLESPSQFLGYELGSRFTRHHQVVDYFRHVASRSDRLVLHQYGETYEGRPLMVAFVGTPERLASLEEVRKDNLRRAGLEDGDPGDAGAAIVWLSYNVHGNESVSTEASMATIYDLVRPGNARAAGWLEDALVVIDPCINPDGRDRYVNWYNQMVGFKGNANPDAREHREPWPGGRTNHYNFDLNRDWAWQTQRESVARLALYNSWLPHVHVDFHEQGVDSPYYFAPAAEPYHGAITNWQRAFQDSIGTNHARYFDAEGWLYFTREVFDLFYPGYGDTYPIFNGSIGMTYEQGGGGRAGLGIETAEGDTLRLTDRIAHHYTTGISTVETTARHADRVLEEFRQFHADASSGATADFKTFVVKATSGRDRLRVLSTHLRRLGIEHGTVSAASRSFSGHDYRSGERAEGRAEPGDLVVSALQPKGVLAGVLMEPDAALPDSLTYDITAWALPYAYGTEAIATEAEIRPDAAYEASSAVLPGGNQPYAYALRWDSPEDVVFLSRAVQEGVDARVAQEPFEVGSDRFEAGTVLFTRAGNENLGHRLDAILYDLAGELNAELVPMSSGRVDLGSDFGSGRVRFLTAPRVAVATGSPVSSGSAGEVWHWFEQQLGYPVAMVNATDLEGLDLDSYDVLVLPSGSYGSVLTDRFLGSLRDWIRGGGRLIAMERAVGALVGRDGFTIKRVEEDEDEEEEDDQDERLRRYADRSREGLTDDIPGAVFRTRVDDSHPLGFGLSRGYYTLRRTTTEYEYLEDGWNVGVLQAGSLLAGQVGVDAQDRVEDSFAFGVQDMGRGSVIYLVDDPVYRGFWYEGRLLLGNAVFMSGR